MAHKPWRIESAEPNLTRGAKTFVAELLADAKVTDLNAFKIQLVERTLASVFQAKEASR